jgi:hypothetical protein
VSGALPASGSVWHPAQSTVDTTQPLSRPAAPRAGNTTSARDSSSPPRPQRRRPPGQPEAGDPQQPALQGLPLPDRRGGAAPGGVVHRHRLAGHRNPPRHQRQRGVGLAHPPAAQIGEPGGVTPGVDVDGEPHVVTGELHGRGVGVHDPAPLEVDHEDRGGRPTQDLWEVRGESRGPGLRRATPDHPKGSARCARPDQPRGRITVGSGLTRLRPQPPENPGPSGDPDGPSAIRPGPCPTEDGTRPGTCSPSAGGGEHARPRTVRCPRRGLRPHG